MCFFVSQWLQNLLGTSKGEGQKTCERNASFSTQLTSCVYSALSCFAQAFGHRQLLFVLVSIICSHVWFGLFRIISASAYCTIRVWEACSCATSSYTWKTVRCSYYFSSMALRAQQLLVATTYFHAEPDKNVSRSLARRVRFKFTVIPCGF